MIIKFGLNLPNNSLHVNKIKYALLIIICCWSVLSFSQSSHYIAGAERTGQYISLLKKKNVAIVANPTSMIGGKHLVDSLEKKDKNQMCICS